MVITDRDVQVLELVDENIGMQPEGTAAACTTVELTWGEPDSAACVALDPKDAGFSLVLCADVLCVLPTLVLPLG